MAEKQDVKEIEANLKRMLNMQSLESKLDEKLGPVDIKKELQTGKKKRNSKDQNNTGDGKNVGENGLAGADRQHEQSLSHHHQSDPALIELNNESQQQAIPKKKKKKPKKKKKQDDTEEQNTTEGKETNLAPAKLEKAVVEHDSGAGLGKEEKKKEDKKEESEESDDDGRPMISLLKTATKVRYLDEKLTPPVLKELEKNKIFPLKKKSTKFPHAKYFCRLCEYHCDNVPVCRQHYNEARHKRRLEVAVQDRMLKKLPEPSKRHLDNLDRILTDICDQYGLSDQDLQERLDIANSVQAFLSESVPGIELRMYGSSLTGLGLKTSDLNLDLRVPDGINPAQLLTKVYRLLNNSDTYKSVKSNFQAKVPSVLFESPSSRVQCEISVNSDLAYYTSRLLALYSKTDPRVRKLTMVYRHWAKICQLDDQQRGSLPSYTFGLMAVFYLQQCKPAVLPVLWKDLSEEVLKRPKTPNDILTMLSNLELERQEWVCKNDDSLGRLWLGLLLYYGISYNVTDHVVSIRQERILLRSEKKWKTKRMAIEDPFSTKRNVARTLFSARIFDYLYSCLKKGCLYFSLPTNHEEISSSSTTSKNKTRQQESSQKQTSTVPLVPEVDKLQVSKSTGSDLKSEQPDKDTVTLLDEDSAGECTVPLTNLDESNSAIFEKVVASDGESNEVGIKENEFFAECVKNNIDTMSDTDNSTKIKEHSFLSSGETSSGVIEEKVPTQSMQDTSVDLSEIEDSLEKLHIKESMEDANSLAAVQEGDCDMKNSIQEGHVESDSAIIEDLSVDKDDGSGKNVIDGRKENIKSIGASEMQSCDSGVSAVNSEVKSIIITSNESGAAESEETRVNVDVCNKIVDPSSDSGESCEQDNILSVYTQEDTDINLQDTIKHSVSADEKNEGEDAKVPEHSILTAEDTNINPSEKECDIEDIVGQSFIAEDDSVLVTELASERIDDATRKEKYKDKVIDDKETGISDESKRDANKDIALLDAGSSSGSESDLELESPESSPIMRKKVKRPSSPENAEYEYVFTVDSLTDGKGPSVFCSICEKEGHLKSSCPEEQLPELKELPPVTQKHLKLLTNVIKAVPSDFQLSQRELEDREAVRRVLECFIQELYPEAQCSLFGSSKNGFGFHFSDLDICVTFRGKNPEDLNFVEVIEALSKKLKTHKSFYNVFPITTAKVPIVKFIHRPTRLEGDISLYNILAQQNTKLLYCYSCIDPRVVILGYAIKVFAKVCDIGDASRGSLSSYAYMLLLFHYLQHTKPPVIPVLQELKKPDENPEVMVDGWNAWFYDDIKNLNKVWPEYKHNRQSVGELWLGLFRYYMEEFDVAEQVVTVKQFETLTKFEKLWNGKCIAIEDPFDLGHNLGAGLTRKMHKYIMMALINARELYGTSVTGTPDGFNSLADYFFDRERLTDGDAPNDRLCRVCSKIGHIAKECPRVLARKEREAEERKRKEELKKTQELRDKTAANMNRGNNQNKPKQQGRSHLGPSRSQSDPADTSPRRPLNRGQMFINRQFSCGAELQSHDRAQDYTPSSPRPISSQTYNRDRQPQGNSPRSYPQCNQPHSPRGFSQGYSQGGFNNQPFGNIPFQWANQNDNSRRNYQPLNQNPGNFPQFSTHQNQGYKTPLLPHPNQLPRNQQANGNRGHLSPANQNRGYQNRKQQQRGQMTHEDRDLSSSPNKNQGYNRSQQQQQTQQQDIDSKRQITLTTGANSIAGMGVTVKNEYYKGKK